MIRYLAPHDLVVLRDQNESITVSIRELARKLILPVNRFFYDGNVLRNSCWRGSAKDMFWEWKRVRDIDSLEYLFNDSLNTCIEANDQRGIRLIISGMDNLWAGIGLIDHRLCAIETLYASRTK